MAITISGENNNDRILASDGVIDQISGINIVGVLTATTFSGDFIGDLTGNVTGNINNSTLLLQTGGYERLRIDSNGRIGLGINNPGSYFSSYNRVVMGRTNDTGGMTIVSAPTSGGYIAFADGTSGNEAYRGRISYYHNLDALAFNTAATERVRIDSSGSVLIGTTTVGYSTADDLTIATSGSTGITIRTGTTNQGNIYFADGTSGASQYAGLITYNHTSNFMFFGTNDGTERFRISNNGDVRVGGGAPASFGSGTTVHETYNASTYVANLVTSGTHQLQMIASQTHGATSIGTRSNHNLNLCANDSTKMTIATDGKVGINQASPRTTLDVSGYLFLGNGQQIQITGSSGAKGLQLIGQDDGTSLIGTMGSSGEHLLFRTASSERMRLLVGGPHLLIGGTSGLNEITESSSNSGLVIGNTSMGNGGLAIINSTSGTGRIYFGDATGSNAARNRGQINYYHNGDYMLFATAGSERLRITSTGAVMINTTNSSSRTLNLNGTFGILSTNQSGVIDMSVSDAGVASIAPYVAGGSTLILKTNASGSGVAERFRITSTGEVGISPGSCTPDAGDLSSGDSQNTPIIHVKGSGTSATQGAYNLLARFEAGGDADGTGAMIVLNHSNDRGLAIQGGRRTGNYAHGALKMIDNVGRVSDAMLIHGGAGQGVDHINFYTGVSTTTTNRLHIDSAGRVLIGTTNNSNGHIAASKAAVLGHLAIFKDSEGDNAGVNSHQLKFVTQSGSISEIQATSNGAGGPAGRGGYLSFFAKENNNATLKEMVRVRTDYLHVLRENTSLEGGQIALSRASDNAAYWMIDSYGSSSTPDFRLHAGGTSHFSINSSGQWVDAPPGTVIQVVYGRYDPNTDTYAVISQDTKARSPAYVDITPLRSDSKLVIQAKLHTRMQNAYGASFGLDYSTDSGSNWTALTTGMVNRGGASLDFFYKGESRNHHYTSHMTTYIDSFTGSRRFSPWGQGWGSGTWELSYGHGEHSVIIFEIAT